MIAVDGSHLSETVRNGFPLAEATLLKISVVSLDLQQLEAAQKEELPSPRVFYDMENAKPFDWVLPGANIDRPGVPGDTPRRFFRESVFEAFNGRIDSSHELCLRRYARWSAARTTRRTRRAAPWKIASNRYAPAPVPTHARASELPRSGKPTLCVLQNGSAKLQPTAKHMVRYDTCLR